MDMHRESPLRSHDARTEQERPCASGGAQVKRRPSRDHASGRPGVGGCSAEACTPTFAAPSRSSHLAPRTCACSTTPPMHRADSCVRAWRSAPRAGATFTSSANRACVTERGGRAAANFSAGTEIENASSGSTPSVPPTRKSMLLRVADVEAGPPPPRMGRAHMSL